MKIEKLHSWTLSIPEAMELQKRLAAKVSRSGEVISPRFIGGVDISAEGQRGMANAAAVILNYPELKLVEVKVVRMEVKFPYVPGLLSFRESPLILAACEQLDNTPDLILVDGQGIAHPRRIGIASHLGLLLNTPTIGCAKSRLCGKHKELSEEAGSYAELVDNGEIIGVVLRSRQGMQPLYISIGHKISLEAAIYWVRECCRGFRIPEPTRLAHLAAGGNLKPEKYAIGAEEGSQRRLF